MRAPGAPARGPGPRPRGGACGGGRRWARPPSPGAEPPASSGRAWPEPKRAGFREGHQLRRQAARAAEREGPLRERFERLAAPERARIAAELPEAKRDLADLQGRHNAYIRFQYDHPEALRRLDRLDEQIATAAWELDVERQGLDGIRPEPPQSSAQRWVTERGIRGLDRGLDLGIDL